MRRRNGFANVDSIDNIVGLFSRRFRLIAFQTNCQGGIKFRYFARDIRLRRSSGCSIRDNRPDIVERGLPVIAQRHDIDEGAINGAADIILANAGLQIAAACPRPRFQSTVDHLQGQQVYQYLLIVDDRIVDLFPGPGNDHRNEARQGRLNHHSADVGNILRIAEIGNSAWLALALPLGKMLVEQRLEQGRITVACDHDHRLLGTIPALMKQLQHPRRRSAQGF